MRKKSRIKKYILWFLISIILLPMIIEVAMILDTLSVMQNIKDNYSGKAPYIENDPLYGMKNYNHEVESLHADKIIHNYKILRAYTLHNFKTGFIDVYIDDRYEDGEGNLLRLAIDVYKYSIKKENGKWKVVEVQELMGD